MQWELSGGRGYYRHTTYTVLIENHDNGGGGGGMKYKYTFEKSFIDAWLTEKNRCTATMHERKETYDATYTSDAESLIVLTVR